MSTIDNKQKGKIKAYQRLARLSDRDYRDILQLRAGVRTSTQLGQDGFDRAMAALEALLWQRVDAGLVPHPPQNIGRTYWRSKCPADGMINTRLRWKLERWWGMLADYLPEAERNEVYLAAIIRQAVGWNGHVAWFNGAALVWERLPAEAARLALEAIKDRLRHAVGGSSQKPESRSQQEGNAA